MNIIVTIAIISIVIIIIGIIKKTCIDVKIPSKRQVFINIFTYFSIYQRMIHVWFSIGSNSVIVDSIFTQSMLIVGITYVGSSINDDRHDGRDDDDDDDGRDGHGRDDDNNIDDNNDDDEYIQHQDDNNGDDASVVHDDDDDKKDYY